MSRFAANDVFYEAVFEVSDERKKLQLKFCSQELSMKKHCTLTSACDGDTIE